MANIKINKEKTLSDKAYKLKTYEFEKPDLEGKMHKQKNEVYFRPDGVTILLVDKKEQKMLFTKQVRLPTYLNGNESGELVETCAGLIDEGETPMDAAKREVEEETGYKVEGMKKVMQGYPSPGGITEIIHFFYCEL
jgi:GDP-mannose pyrophosphatase NudK